MDLAKLKLDKDLYLFELDDVLFPRRDYIIQVYYLFSSFYEFTEGTVEANTMAQFMAKIYDLHGESEVYLATKTMFNIDDKYEENFHRLIANAQIPLKLELSLQVRDLLLDLTNSTKQIAILTKGNPTEQLNKLRFIDWGPFDKLKESLKVYFVDELEFRNLDPLAFIAKEYNLEIHNITYINNLWTLSYLR